MGLRQSALNNLFNTALAAGRTSAEIKANKLRSQQNQFSFEQSQQNIQDQLDQAIAELTQSETVSHETLSNLDKRTKEFKAEQSFNEATQQADKLRQNLGSSVNLQDLANVYSKAASSLGTERVARGIQRELLKNRIEKLQKLKQSNFDLYGGKK